MVATPTGMHTADRNELSYNIKGKTLDIQINILISLGDMKRFKNINQI